MRYTLVRDDDSHWYIIPADKLAEYHTYIRAVYAYWDKGVGELPPEPEWLTSLGGGYQSVTFENPIIRRGAQVLTIEEL